MYKNSLLLARARVPALSKRLVVPAALAVMGFAAACSTDDKKTQTEPACSAIPQMDACAPCTDENGNKSCDGTRGCYWDEVRDTCDQAIS